MPKTVHTVNIRLKGLKGYSLKRAWLKKTILSVLAAEKQAGQLEIDCLITNDPTIQVLNRKYRGIDEPTDVLSFALDEAGPADTVFPGPPGPAAGMGILVVSYPTAVAQAAQNNVAAEEELRLLLVHGVLHILGYDHIRRADALTMRRREREIIGILRKQGP